MPPQEKLPAPVKNGDRKTILAEYQALRDEILKRIEFRNQISNLILVTAAAFLTIGVQDSVPAAVLLVYPILSLFIIASWAHNGEAIRKLCKYVREQIESIVPELHYDTDLQKQSSQHHPFGLLGALSTTGLVLTTQVLAILLALLKCPCTSSATGCRFVPLIPFCPNFDAIDIFLFVCGVISTILTIFLLRNAIQEPKQKPRFQKAG